MPIELSSGFEKGWKRNNAANPVFCVYFKESSGKILFKYAAKIEDIKFWTRYFKDLKEYDNKELCEKLHWLSDNSDYKIEETKKKSCKKDII